MRGTALLNCSGARLLRPAPCAGQHVQRMQRRPLAAPAPRVQSNRGAQVVRAQKAEELPASLRKIVGAFQMVPDPMARYKQLLFYATKLEPLPAEDHIPSNKVEGCVSQVWVVPQLKDDGKIYWRADSDSQLTKGLAALLVQGLSGCSAAEILSVQPDFIEMLGLKQSLTPSRNNGFLNMFKLMQRKALEAVAAKARAEGSVGGASSAASSPPASPSSSSSSSSSGNGNGNGAHSAGNGNGATSAAPSASTSASSAASSSPESNSKYPVRDGMERKLREALQPRKLVIVDESSQHAGHSGSADAFKAAAKAGRNPETHFKVEVVSDAFEGMTLVKRQRWVYQMLEAEFAMGLHALSLVTRTPAEAEKVSA